MSNENAKKEGVLILFSGGIDSTVCLAKALEQGYYVSCLAFSYGQRHSCELRNAAKIAGKYDCDFDVVDIRTNFLEDANCSIVNPHMPVPTGRILNEVESSLNVPGRNLFMLSLAYSKAVVDELHEIWIGCNADDRFWPDCNRQFLDNMNTIFLGISTTWRPLLRTPLLEMHKKDIMSEAFRLGIPIEDTWTCYNPFLKDGHLTPCGKCLSCETREGAFEEYYNELRKRESEANSNKE